MTRFCSIFNQLLQLFPRITEGKRHDLTVARLQSFAPDTVLVFDVGYIDYAWLAHLHCTGDTLVTRGRVNTDYHVTAAAAVRRAAGC